MPKSKLGWCICCVLNILSSMDWIMNLGNLLHFSLYNNYLKEGKCSSFVFSFLRKIVLLSRITSNVLLCLSMLSMTPYGPLGQLDSAVPPVSLPNFLCTQSLPCWWYGRRSRKNFCVSSAQQQLKHPCTISAVPSTNPNNTSLSAAMKKINSTSEKTSTGIPRSFI